MYPIHIFLTSGQAVPEPAGSLSPQHLWLPSALFPRLSPLAPQCGCSSSLFSCTAVTSFQIGKGSQRTRAQQPAGGATDSSAWPAPGLFASGFQMVCGGCGFSFGVSSGCSWCFAPRSLRPPRTSAAALSSVRWREFTFPGTTLRQRGQWPAGAHFSLPLFRPVLSCLFGGSSEGPRGAWQQTH